MKRLARRLALLLTLAGLCLMTGGADGRLGAYLVARPQEERMKNVTVLTAAPAYAPTVPKRLMLLVSSRY